MTKQGSTKAKVPPAGRGKKPAKIRPTSKFELLTVIGQISRFYDGRAPIDMVARRAGYGNANNNALKKALTRAEKSGYLCDLKLDKHHVTLALEGWKHVDESKLASLPMSNAEALTKIQQDLSPKMRECVQLLSDGEARSREFLSTQLGYSSETENAFKKLLSRIRDKGYLTFVDKLSVQLADECFPFGRSSQEPFIV